MTRTRPSWIDDKGFVSMLISVFGYSEKTLEAAANETTGETERQEQFAEKHEIWRQSKHHSVMNVIKIWGEIGTDERQRAAVLPIMPKWLRDAVIHPEGATVQGDDL